MSAASAQEERSRVGPENSRDGDSDDIDVASDSHTHARGISQTESTEENEETGNSGGGRQQNDEGGDSSTSSGGRSEENGEGEEEDEEEEEEQDNEDRESSRDHHESEDEDTMRGHNEALPQDDHVNDEIYIPTTTSTSHLSGFRNMSIQQQQQTSTSAYHHHHRHHSNMRGGGERSQFDSGGRDDGAVGEEGQQHGGERISPVPIDLIDIDLDPSVSAHDAEIQGDHDADGDQLPSSPNMALAGSGSSVAGVGFDSVGGSVISVGGAGGRTSYRRGVSHQHEHSELPSSDHPSTLLYHSQQSTSSSSGILSGGMGGGGRNSFTAVGETTEHLRTLSISNTGNMNNEDQSEERQDVVPVVSRASDVRGEVELSTRRIGDGEGAGVDMQHRRMVVDRGVGGGPVGEEESGDDGNRSGGERDGTGRYTNSVSPDLEEQEQNSGEREPELTFSARPRRQNTPPAERSVEFGESELSDHEEMELENIIPNTDSAGSYFTETESRYRPSQTDRRDRLRCEHRSRASNSGLLSNETASSSIAGVTAGAINIMPNANGASAVTSLSQTEAAAQGAVGGVSGNGEEELVFENSEVEQTDNKQYSKERDWDLQNFTEMFFNVFDKGDFYLHRDKPFSYCTPEANFTRTRDGNLIRDANVSSAADDDSSDSRRRDRTHGHRTGDSRHVNGAGESYEPNDQVLADLGEGDLGATDDSVFLMSPEVAESQLVSQLGESACGPTAVANVLRLLGYVVQPYYVARRVPCRQRDNLAPLPQYLISRSVAGSTHEDLIKGIETVTHGEVTGRLFSTNPRRHFCLRHWLMYWMKKGCVPVLTLNYQNKCENAPEGATVGDGWHYQTVYGVDYKRIHVANPVEAMHAAVLAHYLDSDSWLSVHWRDVCARWDDDCDLNLLTQHPNQDPRWIDYNVLGQVCSLLRVKKRVDSYLQHLHGRSTRDRISTNNNTSTFLSNNNTIMNGAGGSGLVNVPNNHRRAPVDSAGDDEDNDDFDTPTHLHGGSMLNGVLSHNGHQNGHDAANSNQNYSNFYGSSLHTNWYSTDVGFVQQNIGGGFGGGGYDVNMNELDNSEAFFASLHSSHVTIPAIVKAGIIVFCRKSASPQVYQHLMQADELPYSPDLAGHSCR